MMPPNGSLKVNLPKDIAIVISWRRGPNTTFLVWRDNALTGTMMGKESKATDWIEATRLIAEMTRQSIFDALTGQSVVVL